MCDEINRNNFYSEILESETPVLLDFFATWCTPCRMLSAVLDQISDEYNGMLRVCRVNVDNETDLADVYNISEVPTVIFFVDGTPAKRFAGFRTVDEIEEMIARI